MGPRCSSGAGRMRPIGAGGRPDCTPQSPPSVALESALERPGEHACLRIHVFLAFLLVMGKDYMPVVTSVLCGCRQNRMDEWEGGLAMDMVSLMHGPQERTWQTKANCMGVDPDLFFPERGASTREAKEVCRGCVVREDCLEYALANGEKFGIWGGLSERERRRLRRQRAMQRRATAAS